jgi:hypothetical protein
LIRKTVTTIDEELLLDAAKLKLVVFPEMLFRAEDRILLTPTAIKNYLVNCSFSNDHISSNDNSAVQLSGLSKFNVNSYNYEILDPARKLRLRISQIQGRIEYLC